MLDMDTKTNSMNRLLENSSPVIPDFDLLRGGTGRARNRAVELRRGFESPSNSGAVPASSSDVWMDAWRPKGIPELDSPLAD